MVDHQPPGFRFYPTEEELVSFYLHNKLTGQRQDLNLLMDRIIPVINIYDYHPSDLPQFSQQLCHRDPEQWFFFIPRQESEARGGRPNRLTSAGYWKATGSPGFVYSSNHRPVGEKRTMVFYSGRAPNGRKTDWKMNEYKAIDAEASTSSSGGATSPVVRRQVRQEFSLCRVYKKTKSLRSFDRRPPPGPGAVIIGEPSREARQRADDHHEENINIQRAALERTSSRDSSSSGDDGSQQPPQVGGSSNRATTTAVTSNNEAWWDWEWDQLDDLMF